MRTLQLLLLLFPAACAAQTTQGLIAGRVLDAVSGSPAEGAEIRFEQREGLIHGGVPAGRDGGYVLPPLSPGIYLIRASAPGYQAREVHEMVLAVAGRILLDFRLRPLADVWEVRQSRAVFFPDSDYVAVLYGPDVAAISVALAAPPGERGLLEATVSQVVDRQGIRDLPLAGRDVYTLLAMQPGVTSDAATSRGLGLSIAGQRPSAANFLLDGLEANQHLFSGPAMAVSTEAITEYRISTNNYSAEFGGSSGGIANAITASGGNAWHGTLYANWNNEALNANGFQENRQGLGRPVSRTTQPGASIGGPLRRDNLFVSGSFEVLHSHGHGPAEEVALPSAGLLDITAPDSAARHLLEQYPAPAPAGARGLTVREQIRRPVTVDRMFGLGRVDFVPRADRYRMMARVAAARDSRPDFIWSPYPDFVSGLRQPAATLALSLSGNVRPTFFQEFRAGFDADDLHWDRAHPEIPTLIDTSREGVLLPGSLAFYGFRDRGRAWQLQSQSIWSRPRHIVKFGAGLLIRSLSGYLNAGESGRYTFPTVVDFAADLPQSFSVAVDRTHLPDLRIPDSRREYRYRQVSAYGQDDWRLSSWFTVNLGARYEYLGAPANTGPAGDLLVRLGEGDSMDRRLAGADTAVTSEGQRLYRAGPGDLAFRLGAALRLTGDGRTVMRAGWGLFFDRPFDNLWQTVRNNRMTLATFDYRGGPGDFLKPVAAVLPAYGRDAVTAGFPNLTLIEPDWKAGRAASYFLAMQRELGDGWNLELRAQGSQGRHLVATDLVNRPFSVGAAARASNPERSYNPALPLIAYRGNQGESDYHAMIVAVGHRGRRGQFHLGYTWARSIDNQSDPLAGDFFDLSFARVGPAPDYGSIAAFSRQFDARADRGDADFDQRHNLVVQWVYNLPAPSRWRRLLGGWSVAQLAAFRTGFPCTVYAPSGVQPEGGSIVNQRADLLAPALARVRRAVAGGYQLLDAGAFAAPAHDGLGSLGRNAFRGPGMYNIDFSASRTVALGEAARLVLRVDAFNALNHANLNAPDTLLSSPAFGQALYGRKGKATGFPALLPFQETARELQVLVRVEF